MFIAGDQDTLLALLILLDNRDSFVWNLAQAFAGLGAEPVVLRSDRCRLDQLDRATALVVSPGPGRPEQAGISMAAIRRHHRRIPILGVCLGHQAIGAVFGAPVDPGPPVHGVATPVHHDGRGLFQGLPNPLSVARYHSLYVGTPLPAELQPVAHTAEGRLMALRHRHAPTFGVQFHPESFRTPDGPRLLANFLAVIPRPHS